MKGLYQKYIVTKTNGHPLAEGFESIILRIDGGLYVDACRKGVLAFAEAVKGANPKLCGDIQARVKAYELKELGKELSQESSQLGR